MIVCKTVDKVAMLDLDSPKVHVNITMELGDAEKFSEDIAALTEVKQRVEEFWEDCIEWRTDIERREPQKTKERHG